MFRSSILSVFAFILFSSPFAWGQDEFVPGELIIKLKGRSSSQTTSGFMGKIQAKGIRLKGSYPRLNMHHIALKSGASVQQSLEELRNDPDVEYAEPNYILRKADEQIGLLGSPITALQALEDASSSVHSFSPGSYGQSASKVQATEAWAEVPDLNSNPDRPIVAVIDTGVDVTHSVFVDSNAIWVNPGEVAGNNQDDDGNGYIDDVNGYNFNASSGVMEDDDGHGTHVAGIVLGATQDILNAPLEQAKIRIMALKFLGADGAGSTSDAIKAIYYAVDNGARVINNSWGGGNYSQALLEALTYAYTNEVAVVAAAGNSAKNNDATPMYPATYDVPNIISVAASNDFDGLASFSNYGATKVHLAAPGVGILSTWPGGGFAYSNGTSMASPFVAGIAALIVRESPTLTGFQVKSVMMSSTEETSGLLGKVVSGRVNVLNSVANAQAETGAEAYQPTYRAPAAAEEASEEKKAKGGCGLVNGLLGGAAGGRFPPNKPPSVPAIFMILLLFAPVLVLHVMRMRSGKNRRKFERFHMNSEIKVRVGDRELVGAVNTISQGGLSFNVDQMLEKGGIVTMSIQSPDGKDQIQVEGKVVWCEKNNAYGVQFSEAKDGVLSAIQSWSRTLVKAE